MQQNVMEIHNAKQLLTKGFLLRALLNLNKLKMPAKLLMVSYHN